MIDDINCYLLFVNWWIRVHEIANDLPVIASAHLHVEDGRVIGWVMGEDARW